MKIAIASDHAGFEYKERLVEYLRGNGYEVKDFGTYSPESMDYPDTVHPLSVAIEKGEYDKGIVLCGSGNGVSMTANKHQGIRCALCWNVEIAWLARLHNDANSSGIIRKKRFRNCPVSGNAERKACGKTESSSPWNM